MEEMSVTTEFTTSTTKEPAQPTNPSAVIILTVRESFSFLNAAAFTVANTARKIAEARLEMLSSGSATAMRSAAAAVI